MKGSGKRFIGDFREGIHIINYLLLIATINKKIGQLKLKNLKQITLYVVNRQRDIFRGDNNKIFQKTEIQNAKDSYHKE